MTTIMEGKYKTAEELGMEYPRYILFSDVRSKPENIFEEETVYGIIRQYDANKISVSIFDSLQTAYHVYRMFRGEEH